MQAASTNRNRWSFQTALPTGAGTRAASRSRNLRSSRTAPPNGAMESPVRKGQHAEPAMCSRGAMHAWSNRWNQGIVPPLPRMPYHREKRKRSPRTVPAVDGRLPWMVGRKMETKQCAVPTMKLKNNKHGKERRIEGVKPPRQEMRRFGAIHQRRAANTARASASGTRNTGWTGSPV